MQITVNKVVQASSLRSNVCVHASTLVGIVKWPFARVVDLNIVKNNISHWITLVAQNHSGDSTGFSICMFRSVMLLKVIQL